MKLYHCTATRNVDSILKQGLLTGRESGQGERLPFVLFDRNRYKPQAGHRAFIEVEIDDDDPALRVINEAWLEYHGNIPASMITAVCVPPANNDEVFKLMIAGGIEAVNKAFEYKPTR
jgi:hypothetical protein